MRLNQELKEAIRNLFDLMYPGWTDEDLVARPPELRHFTRLVETLAGCDLGSYDVSGVLINGRKEGGKKFGKRRNSFADILELEVKASRVPVTVEDFRTRVMEVFLRDHDPRRVERMMRQWDQSLEFCKNVRSSFGAVRESQMPDTMILRTLVSVRKDKKRRSRKVAQNGPSS